jgi:hypothetical protein
MAALRDMKGIAKLLGYAEEIGLVYSPLTEEQIEELANSPFEYESDTVVEHEGAVGVSGYYDKCPSGWALIAVGPSQRRGVIPKKEWLAIHKREGWATRLEMQRATRSFDVRPGDLVHGRAANGIVRLAEVVSLDAHGHPRRVKFKGIEIDASVVEEGWEKDPKAEEAARELYEKGEVSFLNMWAYKMRLRNLQSRIDKRVIKAKALKPVRNSKDLVAEDDEEFLASAANTDRGRFGRRR